jgi:hypothetical protein
VKPLRGRELGVARQRLAAIVCPDPASASAVERIELALAWFTNGDGIAYPTLETIRQQLAKNGRLLHRSTLTGRTRRLPHFLTIGYLARNGLDLRSGALRGAAVRIVQPDLAETLGFPGAAEAIDRLQAGRWLLLIEAVERAVEASSERDAQTPFPPLKTPTPRRLRFERFARSLTLEQGDVTALESERLPRARARGRGHVASGTSAPATTDPEVAG